MSGSLDKQRKAFKADPDHTRAFEALEEHYFLRGEWKQLVGLYRHRLKGESLRTDPAQAAPLVFRLAQIVEERLEDHELAHEHYKHCARLDPGYRPALQQLRRIHSETGQWDVVIQIAEAESACNLRPDERAQFLAEVGEVWLERLNDPTEALSHFQESLGIDANQPTALAGLSRTLQRLGRHAAAAQALERLVANLHGIERAQPLVALGQLLGGPLDNREQAIECYRRALADDPRNEEAVCALVIDATAREEWSELPDLYDRRFDLAMGAKRRSTVAIEAGHFHLERLTDRNAARQWFERASELSPDDPAVHYSLAELARQSDDSQGLMKALDRIIAHSGQSAPASILLEAADVHSTLGEPERALELLVRARDHAPDNSLVLDALSETLATLNRPAELCEVLETRAGLAAEDPQLRAEIYTELGRRQQLELGDVDAARSAYQSAFEADPQSPGAAAQLVELLTKAESWSELRAFLERARQDGPPPERADFHCALGEICLERLDDGAAAVEAFEAALHHTSDHPRALRGLLASALASGDEEAQIRAYEREATASPDEERRESAIGELTRLLEARGRIPQALEWLESLEQTRPADRHTLETIARLAGSPDPALENAPIDRDRLIHALERLDEVILREEPDAFDASGANRQRLAALHADAGRTQQAIEWYEASLRAEPDNLDSLLALRQHYGAETHPDQRIGVEQRLVEVLPEDQQAEALAQLAALLEERSSDFEGAIDALRRLLALPDMREAAGAAGPTATSHEERLEKLLERTGQFEALGEQLALRRSRLPDQPDASLESQAIALDLQRADLLLDRLERSDEAAALYRSVFERDRHDAKAAQGLERATRMMADPAALAQLLAELSQAESDAVRQTALRFERASLLEGPLTDPEGALASFQELRQSGATNALVEAATRRVDCLLEQTGDFAGLRSLLEAQLLECLDRPGGDAQSQPDEIRMLRERLAALCRDKLRDSEGCIAHLEAIAKTNPDDAGSWQELAVLYADLDRPSDLLRVTNALLACSPGSDEELGLRARALRLSLDLESLDGDRDAVAHAERTLRLDPGHAEATELLCSHYERERRPADIVRVLDARLRSLPNVEANPPAAADAARSPNALARAALRLRISRILSHELGDLPAAIEALEPSLDDAAPLSAIAQPLFAMYEAAGRTEALAQLCHRCAEEAGDDGARIQWQLRRARSLRADSARSDRSGEAVQVYEEVLETHPQEPEARANLKKLYRDRGDHEPLARLLERELALQPDAELETLEELAPLLEEPLQRPEAALPRWLRILEVEPERELAFLHALSLSRDLSEHETQLAVIEHRLQLDLRGERRVLLELRGDLLAGALDRPREALGEYRRALQASQEDPEPAANAEPPVGRVRRSLRDSLERLELWPAFLECIEEELADPGVTPEERTAALERAAEVAFEHIGPDAALPWLERLRAERPTDRDVVARLASLHREAGRNHALLTALDDELRLLEPDDSSRRRELRLERARLFQQPISSAADAAAELEALRDEGAESAEVLEDLDRLYSILGRDRDRCAILEARLSQADDACRRAETAMLYSDALDDAEKAVPHWLHALSLADESDVSRRVEWLNALAKDLERTGRWDAWAQACEARLALAEDDDPAASLDAAARASLQASLASVYADQLGRSQSAARHWRAILELSDDPSAAIDDALRDRSELALISQLREEGSALELEARLSRRLGRGAGSPDEWLELARLRLETLAAPGRAAVAFREVLSHEPGSRAALAGLRRAAESTGDWAGVAQTLEWELERIRDLAPEHRGGMARRLGELRWHRLNQREEAARAFASALETLPGDLQTLRAYAQLCEEAGHWLEAVALLEDEVQSLGESEPERRQDLWLRIARLSRDRCNDTQCATQAYREASQLGALRPSHRRRWAELHRELGERDRFVEVFAAWCDDPSADVQSSDLLSLANELESLDRRGEALERVHQAQLIAEHDPAAWELAARLERESGQCSEAIDSLLRAAELRSGTARAERLAEAAQLAQQSDESRARDLLRRATEADPGNALTFARLAPLEERLDEPAAAERAARQALDLDEALAESGQASGEPRLTSEVRLACALSGGSGARQCEHSEAAERFFRAALELEPQHPEALAAHGELLCERGDSAAGRHALELRLSLGHDPDRALHLTMIGAAVLRAGDAQAAMESFREALSHDASLTSAHAGLVEIQVEAGRIDDAIEALAQWAGHETDDEARCQLLLRAADLELAREQRGAARIWLRQATEAFPSCERAWVRLAELVTPEDDADHEEALRVSAHALQHVNHPRDRARLVLVRAQALEANGQREEAAEAFAEALCLAPLSVEATLGRGRLQRDLGHWADAAAGFREFLAALPEPSADPAEREPVPGAALVYRELGRLMAGPLEDIQEAIRCYECAVALEPELSNVRDPLASLLTHFPERWPDAVHHHKRLLVEDPARKTSIRCLLRIARESNLKGAEQTGLAVLRALGAGSPRELDTAPSHLPKRVVLNERLADDAWERARRLLLDAAEEVEPAAWADTSDAAAGPLTRPYTPAAAQRDPGLAQADTFGHAVCSVRRRLLGNAFAEHSSQEIASAVHALLQVAGREAEFGASPLADDFDRKLSRRAHKRLRRTLHGVSTRSLSDIDFEAWHSELCALATAIALDESDGDLRGALLSLLGASAGRSEHALDLCTTGDLSARITGDRDARELLRRVVVGWASELVGRV